MQFVVRGRAIWLAVSILLSLVVLVFCAALPANIQSWDLPTAIIISEVAWSGTAASPYDEWIELYNRSSSAVNIEGWRITSLYLDVIMHGTIPPGGFFLLERSDDDTISDVPADQIYVGPLSDIGDYLLLYDSSQMVIDSANVDGGPWPAGTAAPAHRSMERVSPWALDSDASWSSNDGESRNGLDAEGNPISGTPRSANSHWQHALDEADLVLTKEGPAVTETGSEITYTIRLDNIGTIEAAGVILSDSLPSELSFVREDSGLPVFHPISGTIVWQVGSMLPGETTTFKLVAESALSYTGVVINQVQAATISTETLTYNNQAQASTMVISPDAPYILIDAVYYDGYEINDPDEAVRLVNIGSSPANLSQWSLTDGIAAAFFPEGVAIAPGESLWISRNALAFSRQFGFNPSFESVESLVEVPNLLGSWPGFSNGGDEVILLDADGIVQDAVVYEGGNTSQSGWNGEAVQPYTIEDTILEEGQILFRKRVENSNFPILDSNSAADWAQDTNDPYRGRRVQYPGWDLDQFGSTVLITEEAHLEIGIAPDNAYDLVSREIEAAQDSIQVAGYSLRSAAVSSDLLDALSRGVSVTVLLEGQPGLGLDDQERHHCMMLEEAGGQCWFMAEDFDQRIFTRYQNYHANYLIIDRLKAIISTVTLDPDGLPSDDKSDGTWGSRGLVLLTSSPSVVNHLQALWEADFDPGNHLDLIRWSAEHPIYGQPPPDTQPITTSGGSGYMLHFPSTLLISNTVSIELVQAPENSLSRLQGLLGLINSTGPGDLILLEEEFEPHYWGEQDGNPSSDPNVRLELLLDAARRGVIVRLLLDSSNDVPLQSRSNWKTCRYLNGVAASESLDLRCSLNNPTGMGIQGSIILIIRGDDSFLHLGSLSGAELSNKADRELAIQVHSDQALLMLSQLFFIDWPHEALLPIVSSRYRGRANYPLISEVLYDPPGSAETEFIELVNPTQSPIDLGGYTLGDAVAQDDYEDVRRIPSNTIVGPQQTIIIATTSAGFWQLYGFKPDFEILESDPLVPNLIDVPEWGNPAAYLKLANHGDEVLLRDPSNTIVDAIAYGSGAVPGILTCPLVPNPNMSLERFPYWKDTYDCAQDFRPSPSPDPGELP